MLDYGWKEWLLTLCLGLFPDAEEDADVDIFVRAFYSVSEFSLLYLPRRDAHNRKRVGLQVAALCFHWKLLLFQLACVYPLSMAKRRELQ